MPAAAVQMSALVCRLAKSISGSLQASVQANECCNYQFEQLFLLKVHGTVG